MGKPKTETIKEKSQPGSVLSGLICILNWSLLKGNKHCWVIPNSTFSSSLSPFLPPLYSENARNPNGSPHRTAALHTEKKRTSMVGFSSSWAAAMLTAGVAVRCRPLFLVFCVMLALHSQGPEFFHKHIQVKAGASQNLPEKQFCQGATVVAGILSPHLPKSCWVLPQATGARRCTKAIEAEPRTQVASETDWAPL